uniref:deazapurine DNA modification protein DpdA family protein n=1 Tax=Nonomuraea sp. CA-251285 TaxID=3240002 RepID=UPI003F491E71
MTALTMPRPHSGRDAAWAQPAPDCNAPRCSCSRRNLTPVAEAVEESTRASGTASRFTFYLGTHMPSWLGRLDVPLFVSHRRLAGRKTFPRARAPWALDSGGFTELSLRGGWTQGPLEYVRAVRRYHEEIGNLRWAAPQDWMCEPGVRKITGRSIEEHQRLTCHNYMMIRSLWRGNPDVHIVPVLQGWDLDDYKRHADMYATTYRLDLEAQPLVGVGSVCRRSHTTDIADIFQAFPTLRMHGFGMKTSGLRLYANNLVLDEDSPRNVFSADSLAWSFAARHEPRHPWCEENAGHKNCANCHRFALAWRYKILHSLPETPDWRIAPDLAHEDLFDLEPLPGGHSARCGLELVGSGRP